MKTYVKLPERLSFASGVLGQNLIYGLLTSYLLIYYTDVALIPTTITAILFLVARIWDAFNDPVMGMLADRTRTKWGKFRPYMLYAPIPIAIMTVLVFSVPEISMTGKTIYIFVTYILWGMIFTIADIPMWSLTSVITPDNKERTSIISLISMFAFIGIIGSSAVTMPLLTKFGGDKSPQAYQLVALTFSIICAITMLGIFFFTKERVQTTSKKLSFKESLQTITCNRPLQLIIISFIVIISLTTIIQGMLVFFAKYNLGDSTLVTPLTLALFFPLLIGTGLTGIVSNRIGKKNTFIITSLLRAMLCIAFYFIGYDNLNNTYIFLGLNGFLTAFPSVLMTTMIADSVDYAEWKTAKRAEGLVFSMRTFVSKLGGALGGGLSALLLGIYGFVPQQAIQSPQALNGIFSTLTIFTGVCTLVSILPMLFYSLTESKLEEINKELRSKQGNENKIAV